MASAGRQPSPALIALVVRQYADFDVFQLVRLLRSRSGGAWPLDARVRFRADLSAAFPGHEITRLSKAKPIAEFRLPDGANEQMPIRVELRTPNYCLASELGPLPQPFLDWVRDQERIGGRAMGEFFDVFNQRMHVLRHELKQRSVRALEPEPLKKSRYQKRLASLIGVSMPSQQAQIPIPIRAWLGMSGLLIDSRRSAVAIAHILSAYLGVRCKMRNLIGRWRPIEKDDQMSLGRSGNVLGRQSLLGRSTWDARAAVALDVESLSYDAVCSLLPLRAAREGDVGPTDAHHGLVAMIRMLLDRRFDCEVTLNIDPDTAPESRLQLPWKDGGLGLRLGQTAWLGRHRGRPVKFSVSAYEQSAAREGAV